MPRIHRCYMGIYGSLQTEFMETKHNGNIHKHGTPIFGNIVVYYSEKAWACVQIGITQRGRLADGDMTTSP